MKIKETIKNNSIWQHISFVVIALSMTIRHLNKKAKKKPLYC